MTVFSDTPAAIDVNAQEIVFAKAISRAADALGLSGAQLARVLDVSEATVSRMRNTGGRLKTTGQSAEMAHMLLDVYELTVEYFGSDAAAAEWLAADNADLGGKPLDLITSIRGMTDVVRYLEHLWRQG